MQKLLFILNISRWYALPMSVLSWLVVYCYSLKNGGNWFYGLIALIGICSSHLATNLFDDYVDYHYLSKKSENNKLILNNTQVEKCSYIVNGSVSLNSVLKIVLFYLLISLLIAIFFLFTVGKGVLVFVFAALFIVLTYPFLSNMRLSELAVGLVYGPILYGGSYFAMFGYFDLNILMLSLPTMFFTINLVFTDNILDKNIDKIEGKKTLPVLLNDDKIISIIHILLLSFGYLSLIMLYVFNIVNWKVVFAFITFPFAIDLLKSIALYNKDNTCCPDKRWFHFPMENITILKNNGSYPYMFRMYQARNLMIYIAIILSIVLYFG